jgi:2-polyprenyl-6-methoxyphenol hydroxylase-like FAD-dependent oxidoreductase
VERTRFLQHLYGHIKDRSNIHEYKEVVSVMSDEDKATVVAKDGSSFTCDIVVGADGVHSFVRNAMNAIQPVSSNPQCKPSLEK